jgi:hypothetical protein
MLRYGVRAHQEAKLRVDHMRSNAVIDANRPACHWERVRRLIARCLPDDLSDDPVEATPRYSDVTLRMRRLVKG